MSQHKNYFFLLFDSSAGACIPLFILVPLPAIKTFLFFNFCSRFLHFKPNDDEKQIELSIIVRAWDQLPLSFVHRGPISSNEIGAVQKP